MTDLTFLKQFTGDNPEKLKKYINMFLTAAPGMMDNMEECLKTGDYDSLKVTAHSLKPQISYMGIKSQEQAIVDIESYAGNRSHLDELPGMIASFRMEVEKAIENLRNEMATL